MSLRIIYDFAGYTKTPLDSVVLGSMLDWTRSAQRIEEAARSQEQALTVVVRDPALAQHLDGYKVSYPVNVSEESADLVAQLAKREGELPADIDEDIVLAGDLLGNLRPTELTITDWILNRLFGIDSFGCPTLDKMGEIRLLCALCQDRKLLCKPFVLHHLQDSLAAWERTGSVLAGWLCKHGTLAANAVLVGRLLAGYPNAVFRQALRDRELVPDVPPGPLPDLPLLAMPHPSDIPTHLVDRLDTLVHDVLINLPLRQYLACVSGALKVELDILVARLKDEVDVIPLGQIRDRFGSLIETGHAGELSELESSWAVKRQLVFPPTDGRVDETWRRIVDFFEGHFLPVWRAARTSSDMGLKERLIEVDEQYTDWLVKHFFELSLLPSSPLADRVAHRNIQRYTREGVRVVWLVIDGASWNALTDHLESALQEQGAHTTKLEPCIAALPTITDVAMLSLVSLSPTETVYSASDQGLWKRISARSRKDREQAFHSQFPDGVYKVVRNGRDVIQALGEESGIYCLIYGEVDALLHKNSDSNLFEKYQKSAIEDLIRWVFDALKTTDAYARSSAGIRLLVTTDHGWTDNLRNEAVGVPQYLMQDGLVEVSHNRILVLCEDYLNPSVQDSLESDWYILSGSRFRLPQQLTYLLPRQLAPIASGSTRLHGGASMLETIVPIVEVAVSQPAWATLVARLEAVNLVAASAGQARLIVKNPNDRDIEDAIVRIDALQVWQQVGPLPREQTVAFDLSAVPLTSGAFKVEGVLEYEVIAVKRRDAFEATITVQPSEQERMTGKHLADELFDGPEGR